MDERQRAQPVGRAGALCIRRFCQRQTVVRYHRLVRGHERLARRDRLAREHERRAVAAADQLDHHVDVVTPRKLGTVVDPGEAPLTCFVDKVAVIMSASPGALGGLRGLVHLQAILGNIKVIVLPDQIAVPKAYDAFNSDGTLKDAKQQAAVEKLGFNLAMVLAKLKA